MHFNPFKRAVPNLLKSVHPFLLAAPLIVNKGDKKEIGWRERTIRNYENRIRDLSSPEKVFSTFASVTKPGDSPSQRYMTIEDFISSLLPFDLHLKKSSIDRLDPSKYKEFFLLVDVNRDGLISRDEFILLSTLLSIPERHITTAFKMFDLDGNGRVDVDEFFTLINVMKQKNFGNRNLLDETKDAHLLRRFFGENFKETISAEDFERFTRQLRKGVHNIEFDLYGPDGNDEISAVDFAKSIVAFCPPKSVATYSARLGDNIDLLAELRIGRNDFVHFNRVLGALDEIRYALDVFVSSSHLLEKKDFQRAVWTVTGKRLGQPQLDTIFALFGSDHGSHLHQKDLFEALESRYATRRKSELVHGLKFKTGCILKCLRK